jgi:dTDP-4-dehydrorhamnose 3,5-epimerase
MIFRKTKFDGVFIIEIEKQEDERGFFARSWDTKEFEKYGLNNKLVQCNISYNKNKGTIRGMHYQIAPYEETKIIRCTKGKIFDVIIDLRTKSKTFKNWIGIELSSNKHNMLYVPGGIAHGFQTLEDNTEIFYQMSEFYNPKFARGIRWDDPTFSIKWPLSVNFISIKDKSYENFS